MQLKIDQNNCSEHVSVIQRCSAGWRCFSVCDRSRAAIARGRHQSINTTIARHPLLARCERSVTLTTAFDPFSCFRSTLNGRSRSMISRFRRLLRVLLRAFFFPSTSQQRNGGAENGLYSGENGSNCLKPNSITLASSKLAPN